MNLHKISFILLAGILLLSTGLSAKIMISSVSCPNTVYQGETAKFTVNYYRQASGWDYSTASGYIGASVRTPYGWKDLSPKPVSLAWYWGSGSKSFYWTVPSNYPTGWYKFVGASWSGYPGYYSTRWDDDYCYFYVKKKTQPPSFRISSIDQTTAFPGKTSRITVRVYNSGSSGTATVKLSGVTTQSKSMYVSKGSYRDFTFDWTPGYYQQGGYKVYARVYYDGSQQDYESRTIFVSSPLSVYNIWAGQNSVQRGKTISLYTSIENKGGYSYYAYPVFTITDRYGKKYTITAPSVKVYAFSTRSATANWYVPYTARDGYYSVEVKLYKGYYYDTLVDTASKSSLFKVSPPPAYFDITSVSKDKSTVTVGDTEYFTVHVKNTGGSGTKYVGASVLNSKGYVVEDLPAQSAYLSAGRELNFYFRWDVPSSQSPGSYRLVTRTWDYCGSSCSGLQDKAYSSYFTVKENPPAFIVTGINLATNQNVFKPGDTVKVKVSYRNNGGPGRAYIGGTVIEPDSYECNTEFKQTAYTETGGTGSVVLSWTVPSGLKKGSYGFISVSWDYCHSVGTTGACYNSGGCSGQQATPRRVYNLFKVDNPPVIEGVSGPYYIKETQTLCLYPTARDPDGDKVQAVLPATFNNGCWTPSTGVVVHNGDSETMYFDIHASDDYFTTTKTVKVVVSNKNLCPTIGDIPEKTVREGEMYCLSKGDISTNDPDGDTVTISYGYPLNKNGCFYTSGYSGEIHSYVTASDGICTVSKNFKINVLYDNPPTLTGVPSEFSMRVGDTFQFDANAYNPYDPEGDQISYSFGAPLDSEGRFTAPHTGEYNTYVKVSSRTKSNKYYFKIKVLANKPPVLVSKNVTGSMVAGDQIRIDLVIRDPEGDQVILKEPAGIAFDSIDYVRSGDTFYYTLYWTPEEDGDYDLGFTAFDGRDSTPITVSISVNPEYYIPAGVSPFQPETGSTGSHTGRNGSGGINPLLPAGAGAAAYAAYLARRRKKKTFPATPLTPVEERNLLYENSTHPPVIHYPHFKWKPKIIMNRSKPAEVIPLEPDNSKLLQFYRDENGNLITSEEYVKNHTRTTVPLNTIVIPGEPLARPTASELSHMKAVLNMIFNNKEHYDTETLQKAEAAAQAYSFLASGKNVTEEQYKNIKTLFSQLESAEMTGLPENQGNWPWDALPDNAAIHVGAGWLGGVYKFGGALWDLGSKAAGALMNFEEAKRKWMMKAATDPAGAWQDVENAAGSAWNTLTDAASAVGGFLGGIVQGGWNAVTHPVETAQSIAKGVGDFVNGTVNWVQGGIKEIQEKGIAGFIYSHADEIIAGTAIAGLVMTVVGGALVLTGVGAPFGAALLGVGVKTMAVAGAAYFAKRSYDFATQPSNEAAWNESSAWDGFALVAEIAGIGIARTLPSGGAAGGSLKAVGQSGDDLVKGTVKLTDDLARTGDDVAKTADDLFKTGDDLAKTADDFIRVKYAGLLDDIAARYGDDMARTAENLLAKYGDDAARVLKAFNKGHVSQETIELLERFKNVKGIDKEIKRIASQVDETGDYAKKAWDSVKGYKNNIKGVEGELKAAAKLESEGYQILEFDRPLGSRDLDVVARAPSGEAVHVQVKNADLSKWKSWLPQFEDTIKAAAKDTSETGPARVKILLSAEEKAKHPKIYEKLEEYVKQLGAKNGVRVDLETI